MRVGLFELVDPPDGQAATVRDTIRAIRYPWARLIPALRDDPDGAVLIRWVDTGQNVSGLYYGDRIEIHLSADPGDEAPFVLAHEIGHLVDDATLVYADRADLAALMHRGPYVTIGHYDHDHPDAAHVERWRSLVADDTPYTARQNECYADLFVAAFAPAVWAGELGSPRRYPRFVHWTDDLAAVRRLTLRRPITVFTDVSDSSPHARNIEHLAGAGVVAGHTDGTFRGGETITRAQAASWIAGALDVAAPGWRPDDV